MAQLDELDLLKALRQPWFAPRQPSAASQARAPHIPTKTPRQGTPAHQPKQR
jgi:hypothetical protein